MPGPSPSFVGEKLTAGSNTRGRGRRRGQDRGRGQIIRQSPDSQEHLAARICGFFVYVYDDDQVDDGFRRNWTFSPQNNLSDLADSE
jgi:hypothetical protein